MLQPKADRLLPTADDPNVKINYRLRHPVPHRLFLDTNVIWQINALGRRSALMPVSEIVSKVGEKGLSDWHSMNWIIDIAERYLIIQFVTSEHTLEELRKYEATVEGNDRLQTALQLFEWWNDFKRTNPWNEDFENSSLRARAWLSSGVFDFLRDSNDRKLIAAAVAAHCSIFLTMDYKTILPHRRRIESITNIRVLRPSQYWKEIRPFV